MLSAPRDRRLLVEEAAGLGKHRKRRRRAQLKLERTQDNLDRALDVEREARTSAAPAASGRRRPPTSTPGSSARRPSCAPRLLASELHGQDDELAGAERAATAAREARAKLDAKLAEVDTRRIGDRGAAVARDRERTEAWGRLTAVRAAHERISVRAEALAARRAELAARRSSAAAPRSARWPTSSPPPPAPAPATIRSPPGSSGSASRSAKRSRRSTRRAAPATTAAAPPGSPRSARPPSAPRRWPAGSRTCSATARQDSLSAAARARGGAGRRARRALRGRRRCTRRRRRARRSARGADARRAAARTTVTDAAARLLARGGRAAGAAARRGRARHRGRGAGRPPRATAATRPPPSSPGSPRSSGASSRPPRRPLGDEERVEIEAKLERLVRRREQLGPVNPLAEREYEEALAHVDEPRDAARGPRDRAVASSQGLIRETDRKIHAAFEETFEATSDELRGADRAPLPGRPRPPAAGRRPPRPEAGARRRRTRTSRGRRRPGRRAREARRRRRTSEDSDEFSSQGVEIEVTPAGKATRRLSLLSGGEKSLVALAFVFSVFLARPSPFYILDEVEAALDDANIDRFLQLVRRFSDRAQFVIVTHQKRTMDAADVLYGVSMGKGGVTKVSRAGSRREPGRARRGRAGRARSVACRAVPTARGRSCSSATARPRRRRRASRSARRAARGGVFARLRESLSTSRQALAPSSRLEPLRHDRRRDLGAARGGADPRRRRRHGRPRRSSAGSRPRSRRARSAARGDPRAAGRAARRARRDRQPPQLDLRRDARR